MGNKDISNKTRDQILKSLTSIFGDGYAQFGSTQTQLKAIPTGHDDLDCLLTKGASGIYLGGVVEMMGGEGAGKSSLALRTVGHAQKMGYLCCWIDAESAFDENIAILNGVDPSQLVMPDLADTRVMQNDGLSLFNSAEVLEMIYKSICSRLFGLIVLDSVAGLIPDRVLADDFDPNSSGVSEVARNMSTMLSKIAQACKKTETSVIFINQIREKVGEYFKDRFHTPGGRALKFFAHQRIGVEKINGEKGKVHHEEGGKKELIGHYARITIVKNRKAPPVPEDVSIEVPVYYKEYFPDNAKKCYDLARALQVISIRNGVLTWKEGEDIIFRIPGESAVLAEIRTKQLEARLAASCVAAAASAPPTKGKKVTPSQHIVALAEQFKPTVDDKKKSAKKGKTLDLTEA